MLESDLHAYVTPPGKTAISGIAGVTRNSRNSGGNTGKKPVKFIVTLEGKLFMEGTAEEVAEELKVHVNAVYVSNKRKRPIKDKYTIKEKKQ